MASRRSRRKVIGAAAAAAAAVAGTSAAPPSVAPVAPPPAGAGATSGTPGNGTAGNPWDEWHVGWDVPQPGDYHNATLGGFRPTGAGWGLNYWAHQMNQQQHGFYYGIQVRPGLDPYQTAVFSIFSASQNTVSNEGGSMCEAGADGGTGITCIIPYDWTLGNAYTVETASRAATGSDCPTGVTNCRLYSAKVYNQGTGVQYHIGAWSSSANGRVQSGSNWLEHVPGNICGDAGGRFGVPEFKYDDWKTASYHAPANGDGNNGCGHAHLSATTVAAITKCYATPWCYHSP